MPIPAVDFAVAVLVGVMQGVLEWLPVSSQGNLVIFMVGALGLNLEEALRYSLWVHVGTLLSAVIYFRRDILELTKKRNELSFLVVATLVSGIVGTPLYFLVKGFPAQQGSLVLATIGALLIVSGVVQLKSRGGKGKKPDKMSALITGIAQGFSALPGISRSGTTTSALLLQGFNGDEALRLSFLLGIPLVFCAEVVLGLTEPVIDTHSLTSASFAFLTGLVSIDFLLKLARKIRFGWFCILLGLLAVIPAIL